MFPPSFLQPFSTATTNAQQQLPSAGMQSMSKTNDVIDTTNHTSLNYPSAMAGNVPFAPNTQQQPSNVVQNDISVNEGVATVPKLAFNQINHNQMMHAAVQPQKYLDEKKTISPRPDEAFNKPTKLPLASPSGRTANQHTPVSASPVANIPTTSMVTPPAASPVNASPSSKRPQRYNAQQAAISITQQLTAKSPNKSPGKSPRQMEMVRQKAESNRGRSRAPRAPNTGARARNASGTTGRGRGRGRNAHVSQIPNALLELNSLPGGDIHNKLQGTVYDLDFDEDENVENLKSLRDHRRKSIDCRQESFRARDASQSPKFPPVTINQKTQRMVFGPSDIRDLRPPSPINHNATNMAPPTTISSAAIPTATSMHEMHPVMPGPVDMRTYNAPTFEATANNSEVFNSSLLRAFASGTADQSLPDIDEESEKDFQSALKASTTKPPSTHLPNATVVQSAVDDTNVTQNPPETVARVEPLIIPTSIIPIALPTVTTIIDENPMAEPPKHSLIKLKIKGPHARPENYTSSVITETSTAMEQPQNNSIRRMRKKELLRQYCTQENMDVVSYDASIDQMHNLPRTGIPKAVDSMSSIPTKDDYKDYASIDTKKRKAGMSRELRQLDPPYDDVPERRRSICSNASNTSSSNPGDNGKRKGRTKQPQMTTPKLKIKIGSKIIETVGTSESGSARPPKKRLANIDVTTLDFRKKTKNSSSSSADDDSTKSKKKKKSREEKRKKKKEKKHEKVEIISSECNESKLIMRFAKRKTEEKPAEVIDQKPLEPPINSIGPIRLKIARNSQGGGYGVVGNSNSMKSTTIENSTNATVNDTTHAPPTPSPLIATRNAPINASALDPTDDKSTRRDIEPLLERIPSIQMFAAEAPTSIAGMYSNLEMNNQRASLDALAHQKLNDKMEPYATSYHGSGIPLSIPSFEMTTPYATHPMHHPTQQLSQIPYMTGSQTLPTQMLLAPNQNIITNHPQTSSPSSSKRPNEHTNDNGNQDKNVSKVDSMLALSKDCEVR